MVGSFISYPTIKPSNLCKLPKEWHKFVAHVSQSLLYCARFLVIVADNNPQT
jgi:hypothetical protein